MSYWRKIQQDVQVSAGNSSIVNLAGGASFPGAGESSLGVAGIQVVLKTDQNCMVYVDQSADGGLNYDVTDTYHYYYAFGGMSWTTQAVGDMFKVRVTNLNPSVTTLYFRLGTALCPIVEAVPRALTDSGLLKTAIYELQGEIAVPVQISPMGQMRTADTFRLVGTAFSGATFDTRFWTKTVQVALGDATIGNGVLTLATNGPTANGSIIVNSTRIGRYIPASSNFYRANIRIPSTTGANTRRWGAFDANDGFYFKYDATGLSLCTRKTAVEATPVSSGSFNGHYGSIWTMDANVHAYEIHWNNSKIYFKIDSQLIHTITSSTSTAADTLSLKVGLECTNTGGNTNNNTMEVRSSTINRLGPIASTPQWFNASGAGATTTLKYGAGQLQRVVINNPTTTATNTIILYDNITGAAPIIATLAVGRAGNTSLTAGAIEYGLPFFTGLTITTNSTADLTIVYE